MTGLGWPAKKSCTMKNDLLRIGRAASFAGERTDAARPIVDALIAADGPAFLIFETLAERRLALTQLARSVDPNAGDEALLVDILRPGARALRCPWRAHRQQFRRS